MQIFVHADVPDGQPRAGEVLLGWLPLLEQPQLGAHVRRLRAAPFPGSAFWWRCGILLHRLPNLKRWGMSRTGPGCGQAGDRPANGAPAPYKRRRPGYRETIEQQNSETPTSTSGFGPSALIPNPVLPPLIPLL